MLSFVASNKCVSLFAFVICIASFASPTAMSKDIPRNADRLWLVYKTPSFIVSRSIERHGDRHISRKDLSNFSSETYESLNTSVTISIDRTAASALSSIDSHQLRDFAKSTSEWLDENMPDQAQGPHHLMMTLIGSEYRFDIRVRHVAKVGKTGDFYMQVGADNSLGSIIDALVAGIHESTHIRQDEGDKLRNEYEASMAERCFMSAVMPASMKYVLPGISSDSDAGRRSTSEKGEFAANAKFMEYLGSSTIDGSDSNQRSIVKRYCTEELDRLRRDRISR